MTDRARFVLLQARAAVPEAATHSRVSRGDALGPNTDVAHITLDVGHMPVGGQYGPYHRPPRRPRGDGHERVTGVGGFGYAPPMPEGERTEYSTPIPLRRNESEMGDGERPNPWSRLEAISSARERLGWLAEHLIAEYDLVAGTDVGVLIDQVAEELHTSLWGDLAAVERVRHRTPRRQLEATWDAALEHE